MREKKGEERSRKKEIRKVSKKIDYGGKWREQEGEVSKISKWVGKHAKWISKWKKETKVMMR